jgi:hypothetical protein
MERNKKEIEEKKKKEIEEKKKKEIEDKKKKVIEDKKKKNIEEIKKEDIDDNRNKDISKDNEEKKNIKQYESLASSFSPDIIRNEIKNIEQHRKELEQKLFKVIQEEKNLKEKLEKETKKKKPNSIPIKIDPDSSISHLRQPIDKLLETQNNIPKNNQNKKSNDNSSNIHYYNTRTTIDPKIITEADKNDIFNDIINTSSNLDPNKKSISNKVLKCKQSNNNFGNVVYIMENDKQKNNNAVFTKNIDNKFNLYKF